MWKKTKFSEVKIDKKVIFFLDGHVEGGKCSVFITQI